MAKRKPTGKDNLQSMDRDAFWIDEDTRSTERAVRDAEAGQKLDAIVGALGGSVDTTATIYNITITLADTEQSQVLPSNTKKFIIKSRNKGKLRLAYASGGTDADYLTIPVGSVFTDDNFYSTVEVFFQSTQPGDIIEIVAYT